MDARESTKAGRFRSLLLRAGVVLGGAFAGTALAWLLGSATASAATVVEQPAVVSDVLGTAGEMLTSAPLLGAEVLPAAPPVVPRIKVDTHRVLTPIVVVDQQFSRPVETRSAGAAVPVHRPAEQPAPVLAARSAEVTPAAEAPTPQRSSVKAVAAAEPVTASAVHQVPVLPEPLRGSAAQPYSGALPTGTCGHPGSTAPGGCCPSEAPSVIPGIGLVRTGSAFGQRVPAATGRQPGVTPD